MSPTATYSNQHHPIIKATYLPRIIAATFMLAICGLKLGYELLFTQYLWLCAIGLLYPHLMYWLSLKSGNGKRQEYINVHFDALLTAIAVSILPDYYFLSTAIIVMIANALYLGSFRLLLRVMFVFLTALAVAMIYIWPFTHFVETDWVIKIVSSVYILVHFSTFAILSYHQARRMLLLNKEVQNLLVTDALTGAFNRRYLDLNLGKEIQRNRHLNQAITVIFTDLDHFKLVNDEYGHQLGDKVLVDFVAITRRCIREDVDWVARFGGEEFIVVLPNANSDIGAQIADRIRQEVNQHLFEFDGLKVSISSSFGVVTLDKNTYNTVDCPVFIAEKLIASADEGLYKAKEKGRNRVEVVSLLA